MLCIFVMVMMSCTTGWQDFKRQLSMVTKVSRNENFGKLQAGYLFPEIARRRNAYLEKNPTANIISLGIGDTTQPIPPHILEGLNSGAAKLGTAAGYTGYGAEQGVKQLREQIAAVLYEGRVQPEEVFVSDGAKCDISRLQMMFGGRVVTAVQDPSYPVYVDTAVMVGQTGPIDPASRQFENIVYMTCNPANGFFPDPYQHPRADVYYLCSPNNPTGAVASRAGLERFVRYAQEHGSIIVFDAAYAPFIRTPGVPRSIFELPGAKSVAIEVNSFSKYAGFTGVRLGWTVVPSELCFSDGSPVRNDWNRVMTTAFNGASNVAQFGGLACLTPDGLREIDQLIDYYLENARILRETFTQLGYKVYGGVDAPYIFVDMGGPGSWEAFTDILERIQVVTIPGAGFGPGGEGYLRMSAFAPRESCLEASRRFIELYKK